MAPESARLCQYHYRSAWACHLNVPFRIQRLTGLNPLVSTSNIYNGYNGLIKNDSTIVRARSCAYARRGKRENNHVLLFFRVPFMPFTQNQWVSGAI
jgi:hypothetical protein